MRNEQCLMSRKEAAQYLGFSYQTLAEWACEKTYPLKYVKFGRDVRYRKKDLDSFIEERVRSGID